MYARARCATHQATANELLKFRFHGALKHGGRVIYAGWARRAARFVRVHTGCSKSVGCALRN